MMKEVGNDDRVEKIAQQKKIVKNSIWYIFGSLCIYISILSDVTYQIEYPCPSGSCNFFHISLSRK